MRLGNRRSPVLPATAVFLAFFWVGHGLIGEAEAQRLAENSLKRQVDPVIVDGALAGEVLASPLSGLRLYAFHAGVFEPIRFQIDEMTGEHGDWILSEGPLPNADLSNARLDPWDKLVFMAEDMGDRVQRDNWVEGYSRGVEIEVVDPVTDERGWCYLLYFNTNPPAYSSLPDHVTYDYDTEVLEARDWRMEYIITDEGLHSTFYKSIALRVQGKLRPSFVDRLKARPIVKLAFGTLTFRFNEERLKSDVLAYKTGPIRIIRRVEQYAQIAGFKALRVVLDNIHSRDVSTVPMVFNMPFQPGKLGLSIVIRFGTDYSPEETAGGMIYNSNNKKGFLIDGKMDDGEEDFNPEFDNWRLIASARGDVFMTRTVLTPEIKEGIKITMGLTDDQSVKDPPETYPGLWGYLWQDWDITHLPRGKYWFFLEFYSIPGWKPGDEVAYCNYLDHPLKIRSGNREVVSQPTLIPELGERYMELYPKKIALGARR